MIIGIPRALIYWKRPAFWETFFKELGLDVLLSPATNKEIVEAGVMAADPETCFSNKVYWGHLLWLSGRCDFIFAPRLKTNKKKLEYCPKFFGIPDLAKILVKTPILSATTDEKKEKFEKTVEWLAKQTGKNKKEAVKALKAALAAEAAINKKTEQEFLAKVQSKKPKIILVSHPYNLYDDYVNLRIKEKINRLGVEPISIEEALSSLPRLQKSDWPQFHWEFVQEIKERIETTLNYAIDGAIEISSFGCGCDAVLKEFVEKEFKSKNIPFLYLMIDEHTAEAGLQTRLEAFIDTLTR